MKNSIKKIVAMLLVSGMSTALFTGCADKSENGEKTSITVGGWPDKEGPELETLEARKTSFEEANEDVVIEPDHWSFDRKTFYAKAAGGQLPIVYNAGFTEMSEIISAEYSADLTDALKKRGYEGMFNPAVLEVISRDGRVYAFPKSVSLMGLMYNVDMFEAAGLMEADGTPKQPKDWNELVEFAVKIKETTGKPGFILPTANRSGGWIFSSIAWSFGVKFITKDEDGNWKANFDTPEAADALQFVKDLKWKYDVVPSNTLIDSEEWWKVVGTGGAAMSLAAGEYTAGAVSKYGMKPEQIGYMAIPAGPKAYVTMLSGDILCVSNVADEKQVDAAVRWIESEVNHMATDAFKKTKKMDFEQKIKNEQLVGVKGLSSWSKESEALKYERDLIDEMTNINPNHVRLYNEFVENCPCEIRPEEPVNCQELYAALDGCIQEVLTNKDADCAELMKKANDDFQKNYLNN